MQNHDKIKADFLQKFIQNSLFDGCSEENFKNTVKQLGLELDQHMLLFPQGHYDVIDLWLETLDQELSAKLEATNADQMKIREKISCAVFTRIELIQSQKNEFMQLYAHLALPLNKLKLLKSTFKTCGIMWYWAGDTSTDWNYYSKRMLLSYVYLSSLLYWFQNHDTNLDTVKEFIDRRIEEVMQIPKIKSKFQEVLKSLSKFKMDLHIKM